MHNLNQTEYELNHIYHLVLFQLQDAGCWIDAATLAASHLHGSDYARYNLTMTFYYMPIYE